MTFDADQPMGGGTALVSPKLRKDLLWAGGAMIFIGALALVMPFFGSLVVEVMIGWLLVITGMLALGTAFSLRGSRMFYAELLRGLMTLAAGFSMLVFPVEGLIALTVIVAVVLLLSGAAQAAFALLLRPFPGWFWCLASALVSIALGSLILVALQNASAVVLGAFLGFGFVSAGTALVLIASKGPKDHPT